MENKQAHPRTKRRLLVRYGVEDAKKTAFTMNVSKSGAFLRTNDVYRPGTTILTEFSFPDRSYSLWAQVIWAKKVPTSLAHVLHCGMGIRFVNPDEEWATFFGSWQQSKN